MDVESDNYEYLRGKLAKYGLNNGEPIVDFVARLDESRRRAAEDNAAVLRILDVAEGTRAPQAVGDLLGAVRTHRRTIEGLVRRLQDAQVKRKALEDVIVSSRNAAKEAGEAAMRANASRLVLKTALRKIEAEADRFGRREGEDVPAFICRQGGDKAATAHPDKRHQRRPNNAKDCARPHALPEGKGRADQPGHSCPDAEHPAGAGRQHQSGAQQLLLAHLWEERPHASISRCRVSSCVRHSSLSHGSSTVLP